MTDFSDFGLARPIMQALADEKHTTPTPIQIEAIPQINSGRDILGIAQTGSGKTAAFALPILNKLAQSPRPNSSKDSPPGECRVLVLTPTRELSAQVLERFEAYGKRISLRTALVIGGVSIGKQKGALRRGVDVVVATPGRLEDLMKQRAVNLDKVETLVLDEVDQMLDLGFIHAIRKIAAALPAKRQNIFFSATMPPTIAKFAGQLLTNPVRVEIAAQERPRIDQSVMFIEKPNKSAALLDIVKREDFTRGLVFMRTKHGADKVVRMLSAAGAQAFAIHGNRSQPQRERALAAFRSGRARILVATDIAARGIDVREVSHVVNYDLPNVAETYVHRIGRTARAGAAGIAVSLCANDERPFLRSIEKLTQQKIAIVHSERSTMAPPNEAANDQRSGEHRRRKPRPQNGGQKPPFKKAQRAKGAAHSPANGAEGGPREEKRKDHGERGTARVRRRRSRGAPGRKLSGQAG